MAHPSFYCCTMQNGHTLPQQLEVYSVQRHRPSQRSGASNIKTHILNGPMTYTVSDTVARGILKKELPDLCIEKLEVDASIHSKQTYMAKPFDGNHVHLTLPPPSWNRLLRAEMYSLRSEGSILSWLSSLPVFQLPRIAASQPLHLKGSDDDVECDDNDDPATLSSSPDTNASDEIIDIPPIANYLGGYVPELIRHGMPRVETKSPEYILTRPVAGVLASSLTGGLSNGAKRSMQWQVGQLVRRTAFHKAPNGRFGPVVNVLRKKPLVTSPSVSRYAAEELSSDMGFKTWSMAFLSLFEAALRDLEDRVVHVSYQELRHQLRRFMPFLDNVRRPSLVVVNASKDDNNLLLTRSSTSTTGELRVELSGIRDWGSCVFGDPLLSSAFAGGPSADFVRGISCPAFDGDPFHSAPLIEDQAHAHIRLLLYECYHALVWIAKPYYGRRNGADDQELPARGRLQGLLYKLEALDDKGLPLPQGHLV
jgi:hypothetical protein